MLWSHGRCGTLGAVNVVFISPNFPPQFHLFCRRLRDRGHVALGLGDCPPGELASDVRASVSDYEFIPEARYDPLLRGMARLVAKHGKVDRVDSLNEFWLGWESQLREDFNVEGPKAAQMRRFRSKSGMREVFQSAGVPCTEGIRLGSHAEVRAFAKQHGYPLVFKPDVGVGAAWTFRVDDDAQLENALQRPLENYVVEAFCQGSLTSFDGLTDPEGRILFCTSHVYSSGVMEMVNEARDVHYYNRREIPPRLVELGEKVVRAFDIKGRFFHIEFFDEGVANGKDFRALEINIRPPGGYTTDMFNYSSDIDIYDLWARVVTGDKAAEFKFERRFHCAHISRRHGRAYAVPHAQLVKELGPALMAHREIPPVLSAAMGNEVYMVRFAELPPLLEAIQRIERRA